MADPVAAFHQHRPRLYGVAYRMLGSRAEAEDVLQEAYLRWHQSDAGAVRTAEAWLTTVVTRLCIDRLRVLRLERETYVGPWLPEPWISAVEDSAPAADRRLELAADLSLAFLVLLERLAPEERAAFLLREVFDSDYVEVAETLGKSEAACRQLVHRAREHLRQERARFAVSAAAHRQLLERFIAALQASDWNSLLALFAPDVAWVSDGGGKTKAALKPVLGAERVTRFALGIWQRYYRPIERRVAIINGAPGLLTFENATPRAALCLDTDGRLIRGVYVVVNPDKLRSAADHV